MNINANVTIMIASCEPGGTTRTTTNPQVSIGGAESWKIEDRSWTIEETAVVFFPGDESLFVVKALFHEEPGPQHENLAKELAQYALRNGYLDRAQAAIP